MTHLISFDYRAYELYTQVEADEMKEEVKHREAKARECMIDASKLAEELHAEQEMSSHLESERKMLESKFRDTQVCLIY